MVTRADWIRVELTAADTTKAQRVARLRQDRDTRRGYRPKGAGTLETNTTGCLGEVAVARYEGVNEKLTTTWEADVARGYDIAGWQVRSTVRPDLGLRLNPGNTGRHLLVFAHEKPVMWLVGWIDAADGFKVAEPRDHNGFTWYRVDPQQLQSLPAQNGYAPVDELRLIDPLTPFFHDSCHGMHALAEHRSCGSAAQRMRIERSRRVLSTIYPPDREQDRPG